jgi:hypothetical protein
MERDVARSDLPESYCSVEKMTSGHLNITLLLNASKRTRFRHSLLYTEHKGVQRDYCRRGGVGSR